MQLEFLQETISKGCKPVPGMVSTMPLLRQAAQTTGEASVIASRFYSDESTA